MSRTTLACAVSALFIGLAAAPHAIAQRYTSADCARLRTDYETLNQRSNEHRAAEREALRIAANSEKAAGEIRGMSGMALQVNLAKAQQLLEQKSEERIDKYRGAAFSPLDKDIIRIRVYIDALKDQQRRAETSELTEGLIDVKRNELDLFAKRLRAQAKLVGEKAAAADAESLLKHAQLQDCLARSSLPLDARDEAYASLPPDAANLDGGYSDYPTDPGGHDGRRYRDGDRDTGGDRRYRDRDERDDSSRARGRRDRDDARGDRGRRDRGDRGDRGRRKGKDRDRDRDRGADCVG